MKKAWIENGSVRDVCPVGLDPVFIYGPDIGANYTVDVPDDAVHGWVNKDGQWMSPPPVIPVKSDEQLQAEIVEATQKRLDDFAKTRNYDGILSACTYATSTVPKFQAEGQYCVEARDATWSTLYQIMADIQAGSRPVPSGFLDVELELPALQWPNP